VAVSIDACVDGLLIGLAYSASTTAGLSMSIATTIEMFFLGLSFSAHLGSTTSSQIKHVVIAAIPPFCLFGAGMAGRALGSLLQDNQGLFIGFIAFAMVALMYLVTQELLMESAEKTEVLSERVKQLISATFFLGMLGGISMDKLLA